MSDIAVIAQEAQASWVRNFNPLLGAVSRWPSRAGIYEPLMVFNTVADAWTPWLATGFTWANDGSRLIFKIREGVRWSDGAPFSPADVVFTLDLLKRFPALDGSGVWKVVASVEATNAGEVVVDFVRPYSPGLELVAHVPIVPIHVWSSIEDPVSFANPDPVATGPFTEVRLFQDQVFELGRNPHYWQPGKPALSALRFPALSSNEQANLALITDELDWGGNFVPSVERVYAARDPAHRIYWFPPYGTMVFLYANATRPLLSDVRVRKALSRAVDRPRIVQFAMYDYTKPADATGLSDVFSRWRDSEVAARNDWVQYEPRIAKRELEDASVTADGSGRRVDANGNPVVFELIVVAGWSDWVRAAQLVARNLSSVGVETRVHMLDMSAWFERLQTGDFDLAIGWSNEGSTPYAFYRWLMSASVVQPVGARASGNWHRYASSKADAVLVKFEATTDLAEQKRLIAELEAIFADEAPAIPLFANPSWGVANTTRITGFPTQQNPFASLSPNRIPDCLLVLTALEPRKHP